MIYLSTWGITYGAPCLDGLDRSLPFARVVKPTFFEEEQRVLVTITDDTGIFHNPQASRKDCKEAFGIFWMAGTSDLTPGEFLAKELAHSKNGPYHAVFDGTAIFKDGKVFFKGRSIPPFSDIHEAIFMMVDEQIGTDDVLVKEAYTVVVEGEKAGKGAGPEPHEERSEHLTAHVNEVMNRVKDRLAKLTAPVPHAVEVGIRHAEMNFWMHPYETYHGGLPTVLVYPKGDGSTFPQLMECPEHVDGRDVLHLMADLGQTRDAKLVVYSATSKSGCLLVCAMTESLLYKMRCPISPYHGDFSLGDWNIERHDAEG